MKRPPKRKVSSLAGLSWRSGLADGRRGAGFGSGSQSSKPRVGESGRTTGGSEKVTGSGASNVTRFRRDGAEELRMADGRRSSPEMEGVGDERRVELVEARELMEPAGECMDELVVEDESCEKRLAEMPSDWMRVAARV